MLERTLAWFGRIGCDFLIPPSPPHALARVCVRWLACPCEHVITAPLSFNGSPLTISLHTKALVVVDPCLLWNEGEVSFPGHFAPRESLIRGKCELFRALIMRDQKSSERNGARALPSAHWTRQKCQRQSEWEGFRNKWVNPPLFFLNSELTVVF